MAGNLLVPRERKEANSGMFGRSGEGAGYGKLGKKHMRQGNIDSGVRRISKKPGKTTATKRGDTFKNKSAGFSFGKM